MAANTDISLRSAVIYSIYIRSHTPEGTFLSIIPDLDRIHALGTDIIWLMPIHPIGEKNKKGSLGCPYANRDYRSVNPSYGTMEDFKTLVHAIRDRGMKCMIDVVYNHTSPDAVLVSEHPDFYFRKPDGNFGNKTADWTDVIDLDYRNRALWDYQIESLRMWAGIVDGFRCDVASLIPVDFWLRAREAVTEINPGCIWLAETVHGSFNVFNRIQGYCAGTDSEMFSAFDMEYDYDIRDVFDRYIRGKAPLSLWLEALNLQETAYPDNYIKMRCLENHDQPRIASLVEDEKVLQNLTATLYFLKGSTLLYAGQEYRNRHLPSLFEKEVFLRDEARNQSSFLSRLAFVKKNVLCCRDYFTAVADDKTNTAILYRDDGKIKKLGVFSLSGKHNTINVNFKNGDYGNLITGETVTIQDGKLHTSGDPIIITE
ncbi:MAG: alpha-amylase [Oscillospiraceae bacterium]|nr:alpha-amylase [Oscillospiraceae bacterium]